MLEYNSVRFQLWHIHSTVSYVWNVIMNEIMHSDAASVLYLIDNDAAKRNCRASIVGEWFQGIKKQTWAAVVQCSADNTGRL